MSPFALVSVGIATSRVVLMLVDLPDVFLPSFLGQYLDMFDSDCRMLRMFRMICLMMKWLKFPIVQGSLGWSLYVGGLETIVFGSIRWCVRWFRPS